MPNWRRNREGRWILPYRATLRRLNFKISLSSKDIATTRDLAGPVMGLSLSRNATLSNRDRRSTLAYCWAGFSSWRFRKPGVLNRCYLLTRRVVVMTTN